MSDEEYGYDGEVPEVDDCFLCDNDGEFVPDCDRWKFVRSDGERFWLCRNCHGQFKDVKEFEEFVSDMTKFRLYGNAAALQRLLILDAPAWIIASTIKCILGRAARDQGKLGVQFRKELKNFLSKQNLI